MFSQMTNRQISIVSLRNLVVQTIERETRAISLLRRKTLRSHIVAVISFLLKGGGVNINLVALSVIWGGEGV